MLMSENLNSNKDNEELRAGDEENKDAVVRPRKMENTPDDVQLSNIESKIIVSKSCTSVLQDAYNCKDHFDEILPNTSNAFRQRTGFVRKGHKCRSAYFVTKELQVQGDSNSRRYNRAASELSVSSDNIARRLQERVCNVNINYVNRGKNPQARDLWSPKKNNRKHENIDCSENYKKQMLRTEMLSMFSRSFIKELLHWRPGKENQFAPSKTTSNAILSKQQSSTPNEVEVYHRQAGLLMTTVCARHKIEPKFIHPAKSVCCLCSEDIHGVYSSKSLHNNMTACAETIDYCLAPSSSVSSFGLRTKSGKSQRNLHCKCVNMKQNSVLNEYSANATEDGRWRKEEARNNTLDEQKINDCAVADHKVYAASIEDVQNVLNNVEIEGENGENIVRKVQPSISMLEKAYHDKKELKEILDNINITFKDYYGDPFISRNAHIYSSHNTRNKSNDNTWKTSPCFRLGQLNLETITKEHSVLEEIVTMLNNNQDKYNALDGNVINAFNNYFYEVEMFISANRNTSGNSGYNPEQNDPGAGNTRKRNKKHDLAMYVDPDKRSQSLQFCLEKARLAWTLRGTIGHMRNRTDHCADVMAYEQSIKNLETSMKNFLELNAENTSKDTFMSEWRPLEVDSSQKKAHQGAKHQRGQNALRKSETFIIEDPRTYAVSHAPKSKQGSRDVCVHKIDCPPGKICLSDNVTFENDETFNFSSDSTQSLSFSSDLLSAEFQSDFSSLSQNRSHFNRRKVNKTERQSSFDSRNPTSEKQLVSKTRYGNKSQVSDFDTSECLSSTELSGKQVNISRGLAVSPMKPPIDIINEKIYSNNKQTRLKHRFSHVNIKGSTFSDVGIHNNELGEKGRPKHSAGNTYLCKRLHLPKVPARSQSFQYGDIIRQNKKSDTKLKVSNNDGETEKQIHRLKAKSVACLPIYANLNSVNNTTTENFLQKPKHTNIQELFSLQTPIHNHVAGRDIQDLAIINTKTISRYSALGKQVRSSTGKHDTYSDLKKIPPGKNDICKQEHRTPSQEQAGFEKFSEDRPCHLNGNSFGQMESSQNSSLHTKVGTHKKWRLPTASRKKTLLRLCSDKCPSITDWSGSDDGAIDNLQVGLSTNDLRYQQKANLSIKLHELNMHAQRRNKISTMLRKKTWPDIPNWVDNAEKGKIMNNKCLILNTKKRSPGVKYDGLEGTHAVDQSWRFSAKRDETLAEQKECAHFSPKQFRSPQELIVAINKDDVFKLHKRIHSPNEKSSCVLENETCKISTYDWWNTRKDKNNARLKDTLTKMVGKIYKKPIFQEGNTATCSTLRNRSFKNLFPISQDCKEGTPESGFKSDNYESKLSPSAMCSKSVSQSHETGIVSQEDTCLVQTAFGFEETGDPNLSSLSTNTNINTGYSSCSQGNQSSESVSTLLSSKISSGTFVNRSCTDLQTLEGSFSNQELDGDNETSGYSKKINATEHLVREISESQPNVVQLPYPFCFVSLKDDKQFLYQGKEDLSNDQNKPEDTKRQKDEMSVVCHAGEIEAETSKIYSVRSPPKCFHSNKHVNCSYFNNLSVNTIILKDKEVHCPSEADNKETFPFAYVGNSFDSSSPSENDYVDFVDSAKKKKATPAVSVDNSDDLLFNGGSKSSCLIQEEKRAVKHSQEISARNFNMTASTTVNCQHTDLLSKSSHIAEDRLGYYKNRSISTIGNKRLRTHSLTSHDSRSHSPGLQKENAIIKYLSNKIKYLENILELRHFPDCSVQHKNHTIDNTKDPLLSKDPRYLQIAATQGLVQTPLPSIMNHASKMHHHSPTLTFEPRRHENPESCHLLTQCPCVQHTGSLCPLGHNWAESNFFVPRKAPLHKSTGCQTAVNYESTNNSRLRPCTLVDSSTQYDADLSEQGDKGTNKLLTVQMTPMHADIEAIKNNVLTGSCPSLHEFMSDQKKELGHMNSKIEAIILTLQDRKDALINKGMEYDKMKARIFELTSQREAEKVFHKITLQAFRSLERDHDRLRQEFFFATCRRFRHGESLVQKRVWSHLNGDDTTSHHNTNHNNIGKFHPALERLSSRHITQEIIVAKYQRRKIDNRQFSSHNCHKSNSNDKTLCMNCCHFTNNWCITKPIRDFGKNRECEERHTSKSKNEAKYLY